MRRATTVAAGGQTASLVGFRGANNINAPMAQRRSDSGARPRACPRSEKDQALEIAVGVVRELPVAQL